LQLKTPISLAGIGEQLNGVADPEKIPGGAEKLGLPDKVSSHFSPRPKQNRLHLVVVIPDSGE